MRGWFGFGAIAAVVAAVGFFLSARGAKLALAALIGGLFVARLKRV